MPSGFSGTGISILFYLVLAFLMPAIQLVRLLRRHSNYKSQFVLRHSIYASMIAVTVLVGVSTLSKAIGLTANSGWHRVMRYGAFGASSMIVFWTILPLMFKLWQYIYDAWFAPDVQIIAPAKPAKIARKYLVQDGVMSPMQRRIFETEYRNNGSAYNEQQLIQHDDSLRHIPKPDAEPLSSTGRLALQLQKAIRGLKQLRLIKHQHKA